MKKIMVNILIISTILCCLFSFLYMQFSIGWLLSLAITCGVTCYHMMIRYLSPVILHCFFHKQYNYKHPWFREKKWEKAFYKTIKVKQWKETMVNFTYDPNEFSTKIHSYQKIVNNMCHAELVHELIVVLSFTSLFFSIPFGTFPVFFITALLAAMFDSCFVIMQRYNRPRIINLLKRYN